MSVRQILRTALGCVRELTGAAGYDRYRERQPPGAPLLTRREYEAARARQSERHPRGGCC